MFKIYFSLNRLFIKLTSMSFFFKLRLLQVFYIKVRSMTKVWGHTNTIKKATAVEIQKFVGN